jgi:alginate O-acetyltransferase complex protein AlgJ
LQTHQIIHADSTLYKDQKGSPVLLIGDSFLGVFQRTGCKSAGVSAHIAYNLGLPVQVTMSYGGGADMVGRIERLGREGLKSTKLVVWMMTARDLYDYYDAWKVLEAINN